MSENDEGRYEMLWNCPFCDSKKLLGLTHRHCPICGAPQDPSTRYFPSDDEKIAVEDHEFVGADKKCPACANPNGAKAKHCANCGSPLDGSAEIDRQSDLVTGPGEAHGGPPAKPTAPTPPTPAGKGKGLVIGIVAVLGVLILGVVLTLVFWKKDVSVTATGHTWKREIKIEKFGPATESTWCNQMPTGAHSITRKQEVRDHKKVPDGQECKTRRVDKGDGTFSQKKECKPKFKKEPIYDAKCRFTINRWKYSRSATTNGTATTPDPVWPTVQLPTSSTAGIVAVGTERQGDKVEVYTVHFKDKEGSDQDCSFPIARWKSVAAGSKWIAEASVMTDSLDCDSLKPAK